jgi:hypothetical protein
LQNSSDRVKTVQMHDVSYFCTYFNSKISQASHSVHTNAEKLGQKLPWICSEKDLGPSNVGRCLLELVQLCLHGHQGCGISDDNLGMGESRHVFPRLRNEHGNVSHRFPIGSEETSPFFLP